MNTQTKSLKSDIALSPCRGTGLLTVTLGILVAGNFILAKYAVLTGASAFAVFYFQLLGASILLLALIAIMGQQLSLQSHHVRYYVIGGILGVSAPQLMAYTALKHIPAGLFTILVTLSPLMTFILTSIYEKRVLPLYRLIGIMIGLAGVCMATMTGFNWETTSHTWILLAICVPVLLGVSNVYRHKALPSDAHAMSLAAGTLLSQALILLPVMLFTGQSYIPAILANSVGYVIIALAGITAISYVFTFVLQRYTDSVGFSQVGYFVTLSGVFIGAVAFDEPLGFAQIGSVALLFLGLAITNGHVALFRKAG